MLTAIITTWQSMPHSLKVLWTGIVIAVSVYVAVELAALCIKSYKHRR